MESREIAPLLAKTKANDGVSVFVRIRPLSLHEKERGVKPLGGLVDSSNKNDTSGNAVAFENQNLTIAGFEGVLGPETSNHDVFMRCFHERLSTVLLGGSATLFCYGYTGGGKTHTAIGYDNERGLFYLAAESLLSRMNRSSITNNKGNDESQSIFLRATACEIYNDSLWDLIGDEKVPCSMRTDSSGQLIVQREPQSEQLDGVADGVKCGQARTDSHATLVTLAKNLRATNVHKAKDLEQIHHSCVTQRACGSSTTHHESSRSHAILRLEVTNAVLENTKEHLQLLEAQLPAFQNALDNLRSEEFLIEYVEYVRVLRSSNRINGEVVGILHPEDYRVDKVDDIGQITLREIEGGSNSRSVEAWGEKLGDQSLKMHYVSVPREYPGGEAEMKAKKRENQLEQEKLKSLLAVKEREISIAKRSYEDILSKSPAVIGGNMLLIDLAGADYDNRTGKEQKESIAINKSLLVLKECLRSLTNVSKRRPPFRESKLTRLLQDSLSPMEISKRRNKLSTCVMIVNISPSEKLEKGTMNSLRYGQMYATYGESTHMKKEYTPRHRPADPKVLNSIMAIYKEKAPEKTEQQVKKIISNHKGREALLLAKVRAKYI